MGTATAAQVLKGVTFTNSSGVGLSGTMPNKGAWTNTPTSSIKVMIPEGYHNGSGYVDTAVVYTNGYNAGVTFAENLTRVDSGNTYVTAVEWTNVELGYKPTHFTFMLIDENGNEYSLATITPDISKIDQRYVQLTDTGFTWNVGQYGFLRSTVYWAASNK